MDNPECQYLKCVRKDIISLRQEISVHQKKLEIANKKLDGSMLEEEEIMKRLTNKIRCKKCEMFYSIHDDISIFHRC